MLLLRGATAPVRKTAAIFRFNTCSSCEEQLEKAYRLVFITEFQYMLLLRGATRSREKSSRTVTFQYMLLLRGATIIVYASSSNSSCFNTCSSCEEQLESANVQISSTGFQYMLLLRGATPDGLKRFARKVVSIHAPLARSNLPKLAYIAARSLFQYMLLLRGATSDDERDYYFERFQYMLLLRGATYNDMEA